VKPALDALIHAPARLSLMALLAAGGEAEFGYVRDSIGVSDSVLSKHASALEAAGYVKIRKGYVGKRPRTWFGITPTGRRAFAAHAKALQDIVAQAGPVQTPIE
jgi:DNA-binding MarR family transcriptional regulator